MPNTCIITGNVKNLLGSAVADCTIKVSATTPFFHGSTWITGELSSTTTESDGDFSITVIETTTVGKKLTFTFEYTDSGAKRQKRYAVYVPNDTTRSLSDLIASEASPITLNTFPASSVTVVPSGNLAATQAQAALVELQTDIDTRATTAALSAHESDTTNIHGIADTSALATKTGTETIQNKTLDNTNTVTLKDTLFTLQDDGDTAKQAKFDLSGITTGNTRTLTVPNASTTLVGTDATQTLTNKTLTAPVISTISNTGTLTLPTATTTLVGRDTTDTLTNKSIDADTNTITNIENADIKAGAAIARNKLASGTASHVLINDGSGVMSSEASLAVSRGGTGAATLTSNNVILGNGTSAVQFVAPGTSGNVLTSDGTTWTSAAPTTAANDHQVRVYAGNGHGSTNNKIRRFSSTDRNVGSYITYADSAANGASFTINTAGWYMVEYADFYSAGNASIGISKNSNQLTTSIASITDSHRLSMTGTTAAGPQLAVAYVKCAQNDVIRPHTDGVPDTTNTTVYFNIAFVRSA